MRGTNRTDARGEMAAGRTPAAGAMKPSPVHLSRPVGTVKTMTRLCIKRARFRVSRLSLENANGTNRPNGSVNLNQRRPQRTCVLSNIRDEKRKMYCSQQCDQTPEAILLYRTPLGGTSDLRKTPGRPPSAAVSATVCSCSNQILYYFTLEGSASHIVPKNASTVSVTSHTGSSTCASANQKRWAQPLSRQESRACERWTRYCRQGGRKLQQRAGPTRRGLQWSS